MGDPDQDKTKIYSDIQVSMRKIREENEDIKREQLQDYLALIKNDITSNNATTQKSVSETLDQLLSLKNEYVQSEVINILHDCIANKSVQRIVLNSINAQIKEQICENKFEVVQVFSLWKNFNISKLVDIIEDVCINQIPFEQCKVFYLNTVIPKMLSTETESEICDMLLEISLKLSNVVTLSKLTTKEIKAFTTDTTEKYIKNIGALRDHGYENWHKLWIFFVRYFNKNIHNSMDLTNKLLRIVEFAFRNSNYEQRLRAYDCWKVLIDNASIDMNHICSPKQIKLLLTPLKAKFSKQEIVICKRFEVFTHLLSKLQDKAVLVLREFLEFCFGPIDEKSDPSKAGQAKTVPVIWIKSVKVLIEVIGHDHSESEECLTTNDIIELKTAIVNKGNFSKHHQIIINSISEACLLLKDINLDVEKTVVIQCVWKSLLKIVLQGTDDVRHKSLQLIATVLDRYIKENEDYFNDLLTIIFTVLMTFEEQHLPEFETHLLKQLLAIVFTLPADGNNSYREAIEKFNNLNTRTAHARDELLNCFATLKTHEKSANDVAKFWQRLANPYDQEYSVKFLSWPALHMHQTKHNIYETYREVAANVNKTENLKVGLLKEFELILQNNPLLSYNITILLKLLAVPNGGKESTNKIFKLFTSMLVVPDIDGHQHFIALALNGYLNSTFHKIDDDELIKNLCICIKQILHAKDYVILRFLPEFLESASENVRKKYSNFLLSAVTDLANRDTDSSTSEKIQKVVTILSTDDNKADTKMNNFKPPGYRSAKIANLIKNSPRSPKANRPRAESPSTLRLFGHDVEKLSPLRVKGSQLNNNTPNRSKKIMKAMQSKATSSPFVDNESTSDFVPIDTVVQIQPDNMTENQKEAMKRRREDIPALYQDLSQSQSQSLSIFNTKSVQANGNEQNNDKKEIETDMIAETVKNEEVEPKIVASGSDLIEETPSSEPMEQDKGETQNEQTQAEEKINEDDEKKKRVQAELKKLAMNIVGAEEFLATSSRSRRPSRRISVDELRNSRRPSRRTSVDELKRNDKDINPKSRRKSMGAAYKKETQETKPTRSKEEAPSQTSKMDTPFDGDSEIKPKEKRSKDEVAPQTLEVNTPPEVSSKPTRKKPKVATEKLELKKGTSNKPEENFEEESKRTNDPSKSATKENQEKSSETPKRRLSPAIEVGREKLDGLNRLKEPLLNSKMTEAVLTPTDKKNKLPETPLSEKIVRKRGRPCKVTTETPKKDLILTVKLTPNDFKIAEEVQNNSFEAKSNKKRKRSNSDSEDIIESSQESFCNVTPVFSTLRSSINITTNTSDKNSTTSTDDEPSAEKTIVYKDLTVSEDIFQTEGTEPTGKSEENGQPMAETPNEENMVIEETEPQKSQCNSEEQTQETQTQETETCNSSYGAEMELQLDLPKKPVLTESEKLMARMDTLSFTSEAFADSSTFCHKNIEDRVSTAEEIQSASPVMVANGEMGTPDIGTPKTERNSLPTSPISGDTPSRTSILLNDTLDISPISSQSNSEEDIQKTSVSFDFKADTEQLEVLVKQEETTPGSTRKEEEKSSVENPVVLNSTPDHRYEENEAPKEQKCTLFKYFSPRHDQKMTFKSGTTMSPSAARIRKLMSNFSGRNTNRNSGESSEDVRQEDILTFSREVPSPLAVPTSSILKRKHLDVDEGLSPCAKRKKVNFSDPCITSKKVFLRDEYQAVTLFPTAAIPGPNKDLRGLFDEAEDTEKLTETENIETEESLQITNPLLLRKDKPIYPKLIDCKDDVLLVLRKVTSPMFITTLLNKLKLKNIKTIGDLAKQSETEINRFPFKVPVVANVNKALDNYYNKNYKRDNEVVENGEQTVERIEASRSEVCNEVNNVSPKKLDVRKALSKLIVKAPSEDVLIKGLWEILQPSIKKEQLILLARDSYKMEAKDLINQTDFPSVIQHITQTIGLPKVFEMMTESMESSDEEAVYFDCIVRQSIDKKPLKLLLQKRSLGDIKNTLMECIEEDIFKRENILEVCFIPLIKQPTDLHSYFSNLTLVQIGDIVTSRVKSCNFQKFFDQTLKKYSSDDVAKLFERKGIFKKVPVDQMADSIIENYSSTEVKDVFDRCITSYPLEQATEVMAGMFNSISEKLPWDMMVGLVGDYLKRMPSRVVEKSN